MALPFSNSVLIYGAAGDPRVSSFDVLNALPLSQARVNYLVNGVDISAKQPLRGQAVAALADDVLFGLKQFVGSTAGKLTATAIVGFVGWQIFGGMIRKRFFS